MNDPQPPSRLVHGLQVVARPEKSVHTYVIVDGELELDLEKSSVVLTIAGSVQSLLDVADAVADSCAEYSRLSASARRSDPAEARRFGDLAARMLEIAQVIEVAVLNPVDADGAPSGEVDDDESQHS